MKQQEPQKDRGGMQSWEVGEWPSHHASGFSLRQGRRGSWHEHVGLLE